MLMPKVHLSAIYQALFKDGVLVAKKAIRASHTYITLGSSGAPVPNLHVIKAMQSLVSKGLVRQTFCWRHYYWTLTDSGIQYIRDFLHLPPEIVPSTLRRKIRPTQSSIAVGKGRGQVRGMSTTSGGRDEYRSGKVNRPRAAFGHDKVAEAGTGSSSSFQFISRESNVEFRGGYRREYERVSKTSLESKSFTVTTSSSSAYGNEIDNRENSRTTESQRRHAREAQTDVRAKANDDFLKFQEKSEFYDPSSKLQSRETANSGDVLPVQANNNTFEEISGRGFDTVTVSHEIRVESSLSVSAESRRVEEEEQDMDLWRQKKRSTDSPDFDESFESKIDEGRDERDRVQKKTFTKWINKYLVKSRRQVDNLYEDLRDGHNLIALLEILSGQTLPREKGRMRFHRLQNVQIALDFLKKRKLRLVNIRNDDITDGNPKLTLGLIWTIILHFQIEDIAVEGEEDLSSKQALLLWAQRNMEGYDNIQVTNFTSSWRDGKAFNAIIHRNRPDLIDMDKVRQSDNKSNLENAFSVAERELGVTRLLDPEDVDVEKPDERSLITYVSSLYDVFPKVPPLPISITVEEWHYTWEDYRILVTSLLEWIRKQISVLRRQENETFENATDAKNALLELKRFEAEELPRKETDKDLVRPKYMDVKIMADKSLGKFAVPSGYEPEKVDTAWDELMSALNGKEASLTTEYNRLEALHNLVLKIMSEAKECREKLEEAERLIKIIETEGDDSDKMQNEVNSLLNDCESRIRVMFGDVQKLKDAKYYLADDMYKTVFLLHEKWVGLRSNYNTALQQAPMIRAALLAKLRPKLEDTDDYRYLKECLDWVSAKQVEVESFPQCNDLPSAEAQSVKLAHVNNEVDAFEDNVSKCHVAKENFEKDTDDYNTYNEDLSTLDVNYSILKNEVQLSERQMESLLKFIREATQHIMWLDEIEEEVTNRDLTQYLSDVEALESRHAELISDVATRELPFNATVHEGERLVRDDHPSRVTVQAYLTILNNKWEWIQDLLSCDEQHIDHLKYYREFHDDCGAAERWIRDRESSIDKRMRAVSLDSEPEDNEQALQDIYQMKEALEKHRSTVTELIARSKKVPCVEERPHPIPKDVNASATALCSYKQMNLAIAKGEDCVLTDKKRPSQWTIINSVGQKGEAPAAIFTLPPPSARCISRVQALERSYLTLLELWRDRHARVQLFVTINNLQRNIKSVMSWTVESYRDMPEDERDSTLQALPRDLKEIDESDSSDPSLPVRIASLRVEVTRCLKHAEALARTLEEGNKEEEKCRRYISRLNVILRRLNTIYGLVNVRVKTALPREVSSVQYVINDHEGSVVELKSLEPEYSEVRDDSRELLEKESCMAASKVELGNQLDVVENKWETTWNVSHLYLDKLKMVHLVLQSTKDAENVVSTLEKKIEENREIPMDSESIRKQQIIYQGLRDTVEDKEPLITSLQRDARKAEEFGVKVVEVSKPSDPQITEDVDAAKYTKDVTDIVDRWQVCKVTIDQKLMKFSDLLPKAEQAEAEEQRCQSLVDRLTKLLAILDSIETSQEAQMTVWLPRSVDALNKSQNSQAQVVDRVEDLKPEYDSVQNFVVTFINEEATGMAPTLPVLRDMLHNVQEKWATVWLITHVYFEKIKGLLFTQQAINECEKTVNNYEKIVADRSEPTPDIEELKARNNLFQKLLADIPIHDTNFEALRKNLNSTQEVARQVPVSLAERCNTDLNSYSDDIRDLEKRWNEIKIKLEALAQELKTLLPQAEKAAAQERLLTDLLSRIRALSRGLDSLTQSQHARMQVNLPSEVMGLNKCIDQQQDVQQKLSNLTAEYEPLSAECKSVLEHENISTPTANAVREESKQMTAKYDALNELSVLFMAKIKVFRQVAEQLHNINAVVTRYQQTLDANDHLPEKDLNALRKQYSVIKALADEVPSHDPKFLDLADILEIAESSSRKLASVTDYPEQDVQQRLKEYENASAHWEEIKKQLYERLHILDKLIPEVEKVASEENIANSLLPLVNALIHELERIESAQVVRADVMLPTDGAGVSRAAQQQKTIVDNLNNDLQGRYEGLTAQCRPLVEKDSTAPSVAKLKAAVEKLDEEWERVSYLVLAYMNKLRLILKIIEVMSLAVPILKTYETEVVKAKPNCNTDVSQLKKQQQTLQELKAAVPTHNPKFVDVTRALKAAEDTVLEKDEEPDQDILAHRSECDAVIMRWEKVKKELDSTLDEIDSIIPQAEKAAQVEARANHLLPSLKELLAELDSMEHSVRARLTMATPAEPDSIDKAIAQQKTTSNRLDELEPKYKALRSEIESLLQESETETPALTLLRSDSDQLAKQWHIVRLLSELYLQKVTALRIVAVQLNDVNQVVTRYETVLNSTENIPSNDLDALKQQCEALKALSREVPSHEPKFTHVKDALGEAENTGAALSKAADTEEQDIPVWKTNFTGVEHRWNDAKKRLEERIDMLTQLIPKLEKAASEEHNAASLLPNVEALLHELERIESAQLVRYDVMLSTDIGAVSRVARQQETIQSKLNYELRPQYENLVSQCSIVVNNSDSSAPSVDKLRASVYQLNEKWENVTRLVQFYMTKLDSILNLLKCLTTCQPVLKRYEEEVAKCNPDGINDVSKLHQSCATLEALKSEVPTHDQKFDSLTKLLDDAKDVTQKDGKELDQDVAAHEPTCRDVSERWMNVKSQLDIILDAVKVAIPIAEKSASIESRCRILLPSLHELISELDSIEHSLLARIGMSMPAEPESVNKVIVQQKETSDRLDKMEPKYKGINSEIDSLLEASDGDTPSLKQLRTDQEVAAKKWNNVRYLSKIYLEKLDCLHEVADSAKTARTTVRAYETELVTHDTMAGDAEGLKHQVQVLATLDEQAPKHEPEFTKLCEAVNKVKDCADQLDKESGVPDQDTQQYAEMSDDLNKRWTDVKDQVRNRIMYARAGEKTLADFQEEVSKQNDYLDKTDTALQSDDLRNVKISSTEIAKQIEQHEVLGESVEGQEPALIKLKALATEFDENAKKYDDTAAKFAPPDADIAAKKSVERKTVTRIVTYEITTVTRRYDKLKNLISERIDRYKIDYDKAKDRENQCDLLQNALHECVENLGELRNKHESVPEPPNVPDDLAMLEELVTKQHATKDKIEAEKPVICQQCDRVEEFLIENHERLPTEKEKLLKSSKTSVEGDIKTLGNDALRKLCVLEQALIDARKAKFALDEKLAESLSNLQQLESKADGLSLKLYALKSEDTDDIAALLAHLEELKTLSDVIQTSSPGVGTASSDAGRFLQDNRDKLAPDSFSELESVKSLLDSKWKAVKENVSELLKDYEERLASAKNEEEQKAAASQKFSELEDLLDHVREWVLQSQDKLDEHNVMEIDEKEALRQLQKVQDHHKFISAPQERIATILGRCSSFLNSDEANLVLEGDKISSLSEEVLHLEKDRLILLSTIQDRLKFLSQTKDELVQFCQEHSAFCSWSNGASNKCSNGQLPSDIAELEKESQEIEKLLAQIGSRSADLRFMKMTSSRLVEAAKLYNSTLLPDDNVPDGETENMVDFTEQAVEKVMTETESNYKHLSNQAHERECLLADVLRKRAAYEAALPLVFPWLEQTESQLETIQKRPLPVEPNALQIQAKEVEHVLQDVVNHSSAVKRIEDTSSDLINLPQEAVEDTEKEDVRTHTDSTKRRYEELCHRVSEKFAELQSALSKSQGVSERLQSLLNWLNALEHQLQMNKAETVATSTKLALKLEDALSIKASVALRSGEVNDLRDECSGLLGGGDGHATDSLHKRMKQLNDIYDKVDHGTSQRCSDLEQLHDKVIPFDARSSELLNSMEDILEILNDGFVNVSGDAELPAAEEKIKNVGKNVEAMRPVFIQVIADGEAIAGDCHLTDASHPRDVMNQLNRTWEDLLELQNEIEEEVKLRKEQLTSFEKSMADFTSWMKAVDDAVGDMTDTIVITSLNKQIEKTQKLLDARDMKEKELDRIMELSNFDIRSTTMSPSRRRLRAHRRKSRGMRKNRPRINQKEGDSTAELKGEAGKAASAIEEQLDDLNTMFDDLSDKISDKQTNLIQIKELRENFDKQVNDLEKVIAPAEKDKSEWEKSADAFGQADVDDLKAKLIEHKKWRENLLSQTNEVRNAVNMSSKLCDPKPRAEGIEEVQQLVKDIERRWKQLLLSSDDYNSALESNTGTLGDFNSRVAQLQEWLADKRNMSSMLGTLVCDPTILATQNQQVEHLQKDVDLKSPQIDDLIAIGKGLSSTGDVPPELLSMQKEWKELKDDLESRKLKIKDILAKVDELSKISKEVTKWSGTTCESINGRMSMLNSKIDQLRSEESVVDSIKTEQLKPNAAKVERCHCLVEELASATDESSTRLAKDMSDKAAKAFDTAEKKIDCLQQVLEEAKHHTALFSDSEAELSSWIRETLVNISACKLYLTEDELLKTQTMLEEVQKVAEEKQTDLKKVSESANRLIILCPSDSDNTEKRKNQLTTDMDKLLLALLTTIESIVNILQGLHELENLIAELADKIKDGEKQLANYRLIPNEAKTDRHVEALKLLQGEQAALAPEVVSLVDHAASLAKESTDTVEINAIKQPADKVHERFRALKNSLDLECGKLADTVQQTEALQDDIRELLIRLNDLEEECDSCEAITRKKDVLSSQLEEMKGMKTKHEDLHSIITSTQSKYKVMVANGDVMDDYNLQQEIEMMSRKDTRMGARINQREEEISRIYNQVNDFHNKMDDTIPKIKDVIQAEQKLGEIPTTVEDILQQQRQFELMRQRSFEPLQTSVQHLHYSGNALIISAAPTVPTNHIADALSDLDHLWNDLTSSMNVKSLKLQKALLSCGRFQDVYTSLCSWLEDAEQLAASQKCPSWEYKVLLAQMEEQKVLQRMVASHQEAVSSFLNEGAQLMTDNSDDASRAHISKQLENLKERWSALCNKVNARENQLNSMIGDAKRFHELTENLCEWLEETERCQANTDVIGTQVERIQEQLIEQQKLCDDITKHRCQLTTIVETPLMEKTSQHSFELLSGLETKIGCVRARYEALLEHVQGRMVILQENLRLCRLFNEDHLRLFAFISETELRLLDGQSNLNDCKPSPVREVLQELETIHDQIMSKKANVDSAMKEGRELMMKCSGEDTIQVQEKLESIKNKYNDLRARSTERVGAMNRCLGLSEEMLKSHEALTRWLGEVEGSLLDLGLDVSDTYSTRQRKFFTGEDKKKLNRLIHTIHPNEYVPLLKSVKRCGKELSLFASCWGDEPLQSIVADDESRFNALTSALQSYQNTKDLADEKLALFYEHEAACAKELEKLNSDVLDFIRITSLDEDYIKMKMAARNEITEKIAGGRSRAQSLFDEGNSLALLFDDEENSNIQEKICALESSAEDIAQVYNASLIDRTLGSAAAYLEAKDDLLPWLEDTQSKISSFDPPAILSKDLIMQQEEVDALREDVVEHRPYVDKLNKLGNQLAQLIVPDNPNLASDIVQSTDDINKSYASLREGVRTRSSVLKSALDESNQFFERMKAVMAKLAGMKNKLLVKEPTTIEADRIKECIGYIKDMEVQMEKILPTYNGLKMLAQQLLERSDEQSLQFTKSVVENQLKEMSSSWDELTELIADKTKLLLALLDSCLRFYKDADSLRTLLRELDTIIDDEVGEPAVDLVLIKQQIEVLETLCEEMDKLEKDLQSLHKEADDLCASTGLQCPNDAPATMEVRSVMEELNDTWNHLQKNVTKTRSKLDEAMNSAIEYQESVQRMLDLVKEACESIDHLPAVATDLEAIKSQIDELNDWRTKTHSYQMEMERLCNQGEQLIARAKGQEEKVNLHNLVNEMRESWKQLNGGILQRKHDLETALLALGQLHHAINELAAWIENTDKELDSHQIPSAENPKQIEIELAKHKILWNDIIAHKATLESLTAAAHDLNSSTSDRGVESKMNDMNSAWEEINAKAQARQWELEECLEMAHDHQQELDSLSRWLLSKENELSQNIPYGGLPETASQQLAEHMEKMEDLAKKKETAEKILANGTEKQHEAELMNKLHAVESKMAQKRSKLEEVLAQAESFHKDLQQFMEWLTQTEKALDANQPPSVILDTLTSHLESHKAFENDVHGHRDILLELDKSGSHLKYFSQKQDGILIKNLLLSVHSRWDKVTSRTSDRTHMLNDLHKKVCQYVDSWNDLNEWLDSALTDLSADFVPATDADKIKALIENHKEFQRAFAAKRQIYDATTRSAKFLRDKAHSYADKSHVDDKQRELKAKWDRLSAKSCERQNELEEALMVTGRLMDAIESMLDWLYVTEPSVAADAPVHGDLHTVINLIDQHRVLLSEIVTREGVIKSLEASSSETCDDPDSSWGKNQMQELLLRWEALCKFAKVKEARLGSAKAQAEEFQVSTQEILDWLSDAEKNLQLNQQLPEDEFQLQEMKATNNEFMADVESKKNEMERTMALGNSILEQAHPDAITPLKHWITTLQSRWDEVVTWAKQHETRLDNAIAEMEKNAEVTKKLIDWLKEGENTLDTRNAEALPPSVETLDKLIVEHQAFQDVMLSLQPEYDSVTRTTKRRPTRSDVLGRKRKSGDLLNEDDSPSSKLQSKWQRVWLKVLDRQQKLQNARDVAQQVANMESFSFDKWRSQYMKWMQNKKSRVMDFFRHIDTDGDGKITRQEFIDGILKSKFSTSEIEMQRVADIFDQDKDGYIDYYEFVAALHPNKESYKPATDADKIEDEVVRQVAKCTCCKRFQVQQISENKYRFGDNQQLRLVRILRSTVMVRVGGGWMALDEFLVKNDPCRAKGRTNTELREKFILPQGASQTMAAFRTKRSQTSKSSLQGSHTPSRGSSRGASPSRSATPQSERLSHTTPKSTSHNGNSRSGKSPASCSSSERSTASRVSAGDVKSPTARFGSSPMTSTPKTGTAQRQSKIPTKGTGGTRRKI